MKKRASMLDHLNSLDPYFAERAIKNAKASGAPLEANYNETSTAINQAFSWGSTPEGSSFWRSLFEDLQDEENKS